MTWPPHVLGDAGFGDLMAQESQLRLDTWCAPGWILAGHALNEPLDVLGQRRSPHSFRTRLPAPPQSETLLMSANDGLRLHHNERRAPARTDSRQGHPEESVASAQAWPWSLPAQHSQLLTQGQVFQGELATRQREQSEKAPDSTNQSHTVGPSQRIACREHAFADQILSLPGWLWSGVKGKSCWATSC